MQYVRRDRAFDQPSAYDPKRTLGNLEVGKGKGESIEPLSKSKHEFMHNMPDCRLIALQGVDLPREEGDWRIDGQKIEDDRFIGRPI